VRHDRQQRYEPIDRRRRGDRVDEPRQRCRIELARPEDRADVPEDGSGEGHRGGPAPAGGQEGIRRVQQQENRRAEAQGGHEEELRHDQQLQREREWRPGDRPHADRSVAGCQHAGAERYAHRDHHPRHDGPRPAGDDQRSDDRKGHDAADEPDRDRVEADEEAPVASTADDDDSECLDDGSDGKQRSESLQALISRDVRLLDRLDRRGVDAHAAFRRPAAQPRSRWTEITSLSCSMRFRTRDSWLTEATCSVARTTAVWSGPTATSAARMLTLASATTWVMSLSRPVRS